MGENKKVRNMEVKEKSFDDNVIKPSPEGEIIQQLREQIGKYQEQAQVMYNKIMELQRGEIFTRLNFLFKILETKDVFDKETIDKTVYEINDLMFNFEEDTTENKQ